MMLFMDGMDTYGATADFSTKWSGPAGWVYDATGGKFSGKSMKFTSDFNNYVHTPKTGIINSNEVYLAFYFKSTGAPSASPSNGGILAFTDSNNAYGASISSGDASAHVGINTGGKLAVRYWKGTTSFDVTGSANVCDSAYHWIEMRLKFATSGGVVQIYVDGVLDINASGATANTSNPTLDKISFRGPQVGSGSSQWIDDLVVWDNSGSGLVGANFPMGAQKIITLKPNGDTSDKDFSRSTGSDNYALVDDATINSDTDYVESSVNGDLDLYDFASLGVTPTGVTAVVVNACVKNPEGGTINAKLTAKSSSSTAQSAAKAVSTAYSTIQHAFVVDPATAVAWTESGINAAQFGLEVST